MLTPLTGFYNIREKNTVYVCREIYVVYFYVVWCQGSTCGGVFAFTKVFFFPSTINGGGGEGELRYADN